MRCPTPYITRAGAFGCGRCLPCRVSKRREWAHRLELEALCHAESCFATLTYSGEITSLEPQHGQLWLKRLRKAFHPRKLRYFLVGEYGDESGRPHFHAAIFGIACSGKSVPRNGGCECPVCSGVRSTWGYGHVMVGRLETKSSNYIAGYVTKKMTSRSDPRLGGRHPEFSRMSLKPGIGADALHDVASAILQYRSGDKDVPLGLQWSKTQVKPLGKYLRRELRKMVGLDEKAPPETVQELANQMQIVRAFAWENDRSVSSVFQELFAPVEALLEARLQLKQRKI